MPPGHKPYGAIQICFFIIITYKLSNTEYNIPDAVCYWFLYWHQSYLTLWGNNSIVFHATACHIFCHIYKQWYYS